MKVEAGFKHILFTFVLFVRARSIIDQWKSRRKRETLGWETRFSFSRRIRSFSIFDGRFRYDGRRKKKKKKMARDDELSGTRLDAIVLPPLPLPWKTEALSLSPPSHRDNDIGERASLLPLCSSLSLLPPPSPPPLSALSPHRRAFSHLAIGLPWRSEGAGRDL